MASTSATASRTSRILLLNPNSSTVMTEGMKAAAIKVQSSSVEIDVYTAPSSAPASINDDVDIHASTTAVMSDITIARDLASKKYDAVLVACFSVHTLIPELIHHKHLVVTGIFEASVLAALSLLPAPVESGEKWGIVTTGKFWEQHLADGVDDFLGYQRQGQGRKFAGVFSTGLNAGDFHSIPPEEVQARLRKATKQLLDTSKVSCVVMGCGGMAGLEDTIRSTAAEVYGKAEAERMYVIDGVQAGILQLEQAVRSRRAFR